MANGESVPDYLYLVLIVIVEMMSIICGTRLTPFAGFASKMLYRTKIKSSGSHPWINRDIIHLVRKIE